MTELKARFGSLSEYQRKQLFERYEQYQRLEFTQYHLFAFAKVFLFLFLNLLLVYLFFLFQIPFFFSLSNTQDTENNVFSSNWHWLVFPLLNVH